MRKVKIWIPNWYFVEMVWFLLFGRRARRICDFFPRSASMSSRYHLADAQAARYFPKISCLGKCARVICEYVLAVTSRSWNSACSPLAARCRRSSSERTATLYSDFCEFVLAVLSRTCSSDWVATLDCDIWLAHCNFPTRRFISDGTATLFHKICKNVLAESSVVSTATSDWKFYENVLVPSSHSVLCP